MDTAIDTTGSAVGVPPSGVSRGSGHWLSSYAAMLRFDIASQRTWLPTFLMTQILFGTGMAIIYGFYIGPGMSRSVALFIVSGAPALAAITAALIGVTTIGHRAEAGRELGLHLVAPGTPIGRRSLRSAQPPVTWPRAQARSLPGRW